MLGMLGFVETDNNDGDNFDIEREYSDDVIGLRVRFDGESVSVYIYLIINI